MGDKISFGRCPALLRKCGIGIVAVILVTLFSAVFSQSTISSQEIVNKSFSSKDTSFEIEKSTEIDNSRSAGANSMGILKTEQLFYPIIQKAADRYGVEAALVKAIIMVESSYNPNAVSRKGAKGLMQLMPRTAEALGVEDSFNPEININAGVRYFKKLMNQFDGDTKLALAAYNAGMRHVRYYDGIPPFQATRYYIDKVYHYYNYYKDQAEQAIGDA